MKIALIFVPLRLRNNWSTLVAQDENVGIMPPLSLAYVAAIAEKAGHQVIIIDAAAEKLSLEATVQRIENFSPDLLGFTMTTYGFHQALGWIKKIKEKVNIPVVVGGWHLAIYPRETMQHNAIDYAIIGEAENTLAGFLQALEQGSSLSDLPGIAFRRAGEIIITPQPQSTDDLDTVPFPARHLLNNQMYFNVLSRVKNFTVMLSARGCPYKCAFCDLNTKKFRMRSAFNFVDEIENNYKEFQIREFDIYDSSFTIDNQRVLMICQEIVKRGLKVSWTVRSRVDTVNKDLLRTMAKAGCNTIMYGIENGNAGILRALNKHRGAGVAEQAVLWARECGIKTLGFFMLGAPGETYGTAKETMRFMNSLNLDYIQVTKLSIFPKTQLYQTLLDRGFGDYWSDFTIDASKERELPLIDTTLTPGAVKKLLKRPTCLFILGRHILSRLSKERQAFLN
jgi:anaerobic magnesium-protoporphyrin IX monomethyl ester cyclase